MNSALPGTVWITDIAHVAEPRARIAFRGENPGWDQWCTFPYETESGITGSMVYAPLVGGAPALRLALPVKGWYRIFLGLASSMPASLGGRPRHPGEVGIRSRHDADAGVGD